MTGLSIGAASPSTSHAPSPEPSTSSAPPVAKRASKACEACRTRRARCTGKTPACERCRSMGIGCRYREKARPGRAGPRATGAAAAVRGAAGAGRGGVEKAAGGKVESVGKATVGIRAVEEDVEAIYLERTGQTISLSLPDMDTHPSLDASGALPPLPHISPDQTSSFLTIFTREVLDFFSFLSQSHLLQLVQRHHDLPASLGDDQIALLFAVYALGAFRLESFSRVQGAEGPTTIDPSSPRIDIAFYRHSLKLLEGATTVTALQALVVLQLYAMSTCSVAATRSLVGKIVYVVQELGLHRKATAAAYPPETGSTILLFYAIFIDTYYAGLVGERPFLPSFDSELLSAQGDSGIASPAMARLVLLERDLIVASHSGKKDIRSASFVLNMESKLWQFIQEFGGQLGDSASMGSSFATTHYHWQRILIRAPCSLDPLLALSSLPLMVRSATQIILNYQSVLDTQRQINCAWPVLARVVGAGNVLVQAVARDELRHIEAQELLAIVLYILNKLATRWQAASTSHSNFCALVATLGLDLPALPSPSWPDEDLFAAHPFGSIGLATPSSDSTFPVDPTMVETDFSTDSFWALNHMHEMWGAHELAGPSF